MIIAISIFDLLRGQIASGAVPPGSYVFTTFAGMGAVRNAQLRYPHSIVCDPLGNLYFSDGENHVIRKMAVDGTVSIVAGQLGLPATADGPAETAGFWYPAGLAMDSAGNIFVGDTGSRRIRKISPSGVVSTIAGHPGPLTSVDGVGVAATFFSVDHITLDHAGNLYVSDTQSHVIRKIVLATQQVTTVAGQVGVAGTSDGIGIAAQFGRPQGIGSDRNGHLYIVDHDGQTVRKMVLATGVVTTLAGSPGVRGATDGSGPNARFDYPTALSTDSNGNAYVADWNSHTIRKVTPAGVVTTVAGIAGARGKADGPLGVGRLDGPQGTAVDATGTIYIADWGNDLIRKVAPTGVMTTILGASSEGSANGIGTNARFNFPVAPAVDPQGNVYVSDRGNASIRKITREGLVTTFTQGIFASGLAADSVGNLYVASDHHEILKFSSGGQRSTIAGSAGVKGSADGIGSAARFNQPSAIAVDASGNLFVTDSVNYTIRKITPANVVTTIAGKTGVQGFLDGTGTNALFGWPSGIAVTSTGTIYIADNWYATIRRISPSGVVTTLAGAPGEQVIADGVGSSAGFFSPNSLALDPDGNLLVTEGVATIRKVTPAGVVTTIGGLPSSTGIVDGIGTAARFHDPRGVAIDSSGTAYIADMSNNSIRMAQNVAPTITTHPIGKTVLNGAGVTFAVAARGNEPLRYQWYKGFTPIEGATSPTLDIPSASTLDAGVYSVQVSNTVGEAQSSQAALAIHVPPAVAIPPLSASAVIGESIKLQVLATGTPAPNFQWRRNGTPIAGATSSSFNIASFTYQDAAAYDVVVSNTAGSAVSEVAVLGVASTEKAAGSAYEFAGDIVHPNGTTYDQVLLTGAAATITADPGQVTRISFLDQSDDICQIEFSGPGTLSVTLDSASGPALPIKYNQDVAYMRGHASIVVSGANESTHLAIFSVGRITAPNPALYRGVFYDGFADVASITIGSKNGKFGGIRAANATLYARKGITGIQAPGVTFAGPVFVAGINALEVATPVLLLGGSDDVRITGGNLHQSNGRPIRVSGVTQLKFADGTNSHGVLRKAQHNLGRLEHDGTDITAQIVVNPP